MAADGEGTHKPFGAVFGKITCYPIEVGTLIGRLSINLNIEYALVIVGLFLH